MAAPTTKRLLRRLRELLASTVIAADIDLVAVQDADAAERARFLGSPTLRIDGEDIEPGADQRSDFGLKCRLYATCHGSTRPRSGSPVVVPRWNAPQHSGRPLKRGCRA